MRCFLLTNNGAAISSSSALSSLSGICRLGAKHVCDAVSLFSTATATAANDKPDDDAWLLETTSTALAVTRGNSVFSLDCVLSCTAAAALSALLCEVALNTTGSTENSGVGLGVDDRLDNLTGAWVKPTVEDSCRGTLLRPSLAHTHKHSQPVVHL